MNIKSDLHSPSIAAAAASAAVYSATASSAAASPAAMAFPLPPLPPLLSSPPPLAHNLLTKGRINRNVSRK